MKRYVCAGVGIAVIILISFLVVEALEIEMLTDPSGMIGGGGIVAALIGSGLLLADVFIPVPSSIIMIAHGAAFGVVPGFLLSLAASVGGAMIGWWIGKKGSHLMDRIVTPTEKQQANQFIFRYGLAAIILSRMLPILAETVAILSGTTDFGWKRVLLAATAGSIPPALVYAIAGSVTTDFASGAIVTVGVVFLAGIGWLISKHLLTTTAAERARTVLRDD